MKKYIALMLALALTMSLLAGCGGSGDTGNENPNVTSDQDSHLGDITYFGDDNAEIDYDKVLTIGTETDIGSLYPGGTTTSGKKMSNQLLYENLFWLDQDGTLYPVIAKSYEYLGDGKYTVEIFDYVYDSAGNHLTAEDCVFSIGWFIEDGQNVSTTATLVDYYTTGEYTFELVFDPLVVGQFETLVNQIFMFSEDAWNNSPDEMTTTPVGTGGYVLTDYVLGSSYAFERRDDYWQTDEQYICPMNSHTVAAFQLEVIPDTSTLAVALETGDIDFTVDIVAEDRGIFADDNGVAKDGWLMTQGADNSFAHMVFNCGPDSPLQDLNLRRAICYAIDAAACAYSAQGAYGVVCNAATNPGLGDATVDMGHDDYFAYDPDYAKELVADSSYAGEVIRMLVLPTARISNCAPLIKQYCAEVGIEMDLLQYDFAQYRTLKVDETGLEYDIELLGVTASDDYVFRSLVELDINTYSNGKNHCYIYDEKLQNLYDEVKNVETNSPEAVQALLDYVEEQCYVYGLYYAPKIYFANAEKISYVPTGMQDVPVYGAIR